MENNNKDDDCNESFVIKIQNARAIGEAADSMSDELGKV